MPILDPAAAVDTAVVDTADPAAVAAAAEAAKDPMEDAAEKLFDGKGPPKVGIAADADKPAEVKEERDPALPPEGETDEQKATREAAETPEQKTAREEAEAKEAEKAKKVEGAPEAYADFVVPEGVKLDAEATESFKATAKELNLNQEGAQKLVDQAIALQNKWAESAATQLETVKEGWREAARTDKEFGGDKLQESLAVAQKALKQFGSPELNELVVGAGLGDHPEFIRLMVKVGKSIGEAPIVNGGQPAAKDAASVMYPTLPRKTS